METLLEEAGYRIQYGKGNFKPGKCVVQEQRVIVLNKFYDTEARINSIIDIIHQVEIELGNLSDKSVRLLQQIFAELKEREQAETSASVDHEN